MQPLTKFSLFWWRWLIAVIFGVMLFGISMVVAPGLIRQFFSLIVYSSSEHISTFGNDAVAYVSLVHAILGAIMFGWGIALLFTAFYSFRHGNKEGWQTIAVSVTAWFIPDTLFSLWAGFWQNALLNLVFVVLFLIPLAATYRSFHRVHTA